MDYRSTIDFCNNTLYNPLLYLVCKIVAAEELDLGVFVDLTGQVFGRLTVLNRAEDYISPSGSKRVRWHCKCECGNETTVTGDLLKKGKTRSCGCLQSELTSKRSLENLSGQRFSRLTVISRADDYVDESGNHRVRWRCLCDCGNEIDVLAKTLKNGMTQSCGCLKNETTSRRFFKNIVGCKFGRWLVLKRENDYVSPSGYRRTQWLCRCSCGEERVVDSSSLLTGRSTSCGCYKAEVTSKNTLIDIIGKRFGRLVVLDRTTDHITAGGRKIPCYLCQCDCGNNHTATSSSLLSGSVKSCGCLKVDNWHHPYNFNDLKGKKIGRWLVLERASDTVYDGSSHDTRWLCECECGTKRIVLANSLTRGVSLSCGCWRQSKLELWTSQYLQESGMKFGVDYCPQVSFEDLTGLSSSRLRYDFAIYEDSELYCFIECQGQQHYQPVAYFGGQQKLELQQFYDELKREYAQKLGVCLIEIPYTANSYEKVVDLLQGCGL